MKTTDTNGIGNSRKLYIFVPISNSVLSFLYGSNEIDHNNFNMLRLLDNEIIYDDMPIINRENENADDLFSMHGTKATLGV